MSSAAIAAQAHLHHQLFLGLQLLVAVEERKQVVFDWMFRLFRRQHEEKFLSSFEKLGLSGQPAAIACAKYHVLSNGIGGVAVEYMEESVSKAWVRFRYPRWMYAGPAICGIPIEAGRGFLHGWYAQNGVSLGNPRLGFVCVSEDVTGQFGLCGYFKEYDHDLTEDERLLFAPDEVPPPFDPAQQPAPPAQDWSEERLAKANRNYAMEYVRNGLSALTDVIGQERALAHACRATRLTGLQNYAALAEAVGAIDGGPEAAAEFLEMMFAGMGDDCERFRDEDGTQRIVQTGLRIVRGLSGAHRDDLLMCWTELWRGAVHSHRAFIQMECDIAEDKLTWALRPRSV
ncbi:MAG: hypothetical protein AAGL99_16110 [Pseudomonadota bacterium]